MDKLKIDQKKAYDIIMSGKDVFITGGAGTGKSHLLRKVINDMRDSGKQVLVCAPTGMAALNVGGATIHRTFGYGKEPCITEKHPKLVVRSPRVIRSADVIIIDEVSMCRMDMMDSIIKSVDKAKEKAKHNIQLVVVGDFCQLPPILPEKSSDRVIIEAFYGKPVGPAFAFQAKGWKGRFVTVVLEEIVRQKDQEFARHLNMLRMCKLGCLDYFNYESAQNPIKDAVSIYTTNAEVDKANGTALNSLEGKEYILKPVIQGITDGITPEDYGIPSILRLKPFAEIIMTSNDMNGRYATVENFGGLIPGWNRGPLYYNGVRGTILDIDQDEEDPMNDTLLISIYRGRQINLKRQRYDIYKYVVDDNNEISKIILCSIWQFPVKLAYAVTVHRGQGQTYEKANINPSCRMSGQAYVAISRVTDIKKLYLYKPLRSSDLYLNPFVKEFYEHIEDENYIPSWEAVPSEKDTPQKEEIISKKRINEKNVEVIVENKQEEKRTEKNIPAKKGGRPARYPTGSKVIRIPNELAKPLEKALEMVCPKSGMNEEMLSKLIEAIEKALQ